MFLQMRPHTDDPDANDDDAAGDPNATDNYDGSIDSNNPNICQESATNISKMPTSPKNIFKRH